MLAIMKTRGLGIVLVAAALLPVMSFGQEPLPMIGAGVKVSPLGIGVEGTTAVTRSSNVRGAFNFLNYDHTFNRGGITYNAGLGFRSLQFTYDQYLFKGFHVSPGLLAYNGNHADGTAFVPAGQSFTLGGVRYFSGASAPVNGTGRVEFRKAAPLVMVGIGNPLPRSGRRFGFNLDVGVVFQGPPQTTLGFTGTACTAGPAAGCVNAATNPAVQSNIQAEQTKINNDLDPLRYYPVVSFGVSWMIK
jgi:hypothetical protein